MNKTLFLLPNMVASKKVKNEIINTGTKETQVKVLTKDDVGLEYFNNRKVTLRESSDLIASLRKGAGIGFIVGLFIFIALDRAYDVSFINASTLVIGLIISTCIGAWFASLIGVSVVDPTFEKFLSYVDKGHALIVVDDMPLQQKDHIISSFPVEMYATC